MSGPTTILCVDHESRVLSLRATLLSIAGYHVLAATECPSAMRMFGANHVDLVVISDSLMDSVWHEASCQMKHLKPEVPIILYTAFTELSNEPHCADLILSKGMHPDEFLAEVANLIAKRRAPGPAA